MGRSFSPAGQVGVATYRHEPSQEYFAIGVRHGQPSQRRHQLAGNGAITNVIERSIDFVLGSGNHARTFLHRNPRGELVELPLAWYSENGGTWAMSPGYDRPDHLEFSRKLDRECMFCHSGAADPAPIDCQRCHGRGDEHIRNPRSGAIVNPARLNPRARLEICLQCHLESSSRALPYAVRRYGRDYFSYRPGEPLQDYILHFDRAGGAGATFEIAHAGYRFLQSACYRRSKGTLTCTTCHDPHGEASGAEARQRSERVCRNCHFALSALHQAVTACLDCHMPKRRTDDVVHAVMTDHGIPKRVPDADPLAWKREAPEADTIYRGEVVLLYPPSLPDNVETELYLGLAQIVDASNYPGGVPRLRSALARAPAAPAEFYAELAKAYSKMGRLDEALRWFAEALRRRPDLNEARLNYALALQQAGRAEDGVLILQRAPPTPEVLNALGSILMHSGKLDEAVVRFRQALAGDSGIAEIHLNLGAALSRQGDPAGAIAALRTAMALRPNLVAVRNNLGGILNARGDHAEAVEHLSYAIRIDPNYAPVRYNYGRALEAQGRLDEAIEQYRHALRIQPEMKEAKAGLERVLARVR